MNVHDFGRMKSERRKITMVTCYDHWSARIIDESEVDCVLVGDSVSMVVHGHPTTLHATTDLMELHVAAVARGLRRKFLIGDLPFLSYRKGERAALDCVERIMRAGAHAVKLEGVWGHEATVDAIVRSGVPVAGHIGMTPQSIHGLGGFKVQGRAEAAAADLLRQARKLEELGCFSLVLECVPDAVAREITVALSIPTIGIGAGAGTDGQVLVLQDLLGMNVGFAPKFLRTFVDGRGAVLAGLNAFHGEATRGTFPGATETYA